MRASKNIRRPFRRYEKSIEREVIGKTDETGEAPQIYTDITASTNTPVVALKPQPDDENTNESGNVKKDAKEINYPGDRQKN
jgi:hypothetical protein